MHFQAAFTIPASTPSSSPTEATMPLTAGTIRRVSVQFPWGCAGLVGVRILRYRQQLYPLTAGQWFLANDQTFQIDDDYDLSDGPHELTVVGFNDDDTFSHTIYIHADIMIDAGRESERRRGVLDSIRNLLGGQP